MLRSRAQARVLSGLFATVREGELCALMGESGSGKTTLLNALGGRASYGKVGGSIRLNGKPFEPQSVNLGFVPQSCTQRGHRTHGHRTRPTLQ